MGSDIRTFSGEQTFKTRNFDAFLIVRQCKLTYLFRLKKIDPINPNLIKKRAKEIGSSDSTR